MKTDNELIAEFMGYFDKDVEGWWEAGGQKPIIGQILCFQIKNAQFHTSWDWLMPVVEKIETKASTQIMFDRNDMQYSCIIGRYQRNEFSEPTWESLDFNQDYIEIYSDSRIKAVYRAVVEFINFYNTQSK